MMLKYLITFAIILKTTTTFTIAAFVVSPYIITSLTTFSNFRTEGIRIAFKTGFNRALSLLLVPKIVRAIVAVAHMTKLAIRKTIAITKTKILLAPILPKEYIYRLKKFNIKVVCVVFNSTKNNLLMDILFLH